MSTIAIISDIHGNFPALQAVLAEIDRLGIQSIVSLGDIAGYYCNINECIDEMRLRNITNIMGNHDSYIVDAKRCERSVSANVCLDYQDRVISSVNRAWLANSLSKLSMDFCGMTLSMVHGGWRDPLDEYMHTVIEEYFENHPEQYFFSGHTHVQLLVKFRKQIYCNPGSVGQPRDGNCKAAFATLESSGEIVLKRIEYDIESVASAMKTAGFEPRYFQNLFSGTKIGGGVTKIKVDT